MSKSAPKSRIPKRSPPFNFGSASSRDLWIFGCARPGHSHPQVGTPRTPRGPPVEDHDFRKWVSFLRGRRVKHIICLLSNAELTFFSSPYLKTCSACFHVTHVAPNNPDALNLILKAMETAAKLQERLVVHCASGQKRTGDALALWLHHHYRLSVGAAVAEVVGFSKEHRLLRRPSAEGVLSLLAPETLRATRPPLPPAWAIGSTPRMVGTPGRPASSSGRNGGSEKDRKSLHIAVLQMGGEIDQQLVQRDGGGSGGVVIGPPAAVRILKQFPIGFTFDLISVCRKEGQNVTDTDRQRLVSTCEECKTPKLVVTHGVRGMIATALCLRRSEALSSKTVVVTGATAPDCVRHSDGAFNMGVALGALNVLRRGVFICMHGRVFESSRCQYDEVSGLFVSSKRPGSASSKPSS